MQGGGFGNALGGLSNYMRLKREKLKQGNYSRRATLAIANAQNTINTKLAHNDGSLERKKTKTKTLNSTKTNKTIKE